MTSIRVSIIIPTLNRPRQLAATLRSLRPEVPPTTEILVVDQSSAPAPTPDVEALGPDDRVRNVQAARADLPGARNLGIHLSRGEVLIFCDDDVRVHAGFVDGHLANYRRPQVGAVAGRVLTQEKKGKATPGRVGRVSKWTGRQVDGFESLVKQPVEHGQGCNLSFRKAALEAIGGFDSRFGGTAFLEDTDACLSVGAAGYEIIFDPAATVTHLKAAVGGCRPINPEHWYYWYGHNYVLLFLKHFRREAIAPFLAFRLANLVRGALRHPRFSVFAAGVRGMRQAVQTFKNGQANSMEATLARSADYKRLSAHC